MSIIDNITAQGIKLDRPITKEQAIESLFYQAVLKEGLTPFFDVKEDYKYAFFSPVIGEDVYNTEITVEYRDARGALGEKLFKTIKYNRLDLSKLILDNYPNYSDLFKDNLNFLREIENLGERDLAKRLEVFFASKLNIGKSTDIEEVDTYLNVYSNDDKYSIYVASSDPVLDSLVGFEILKDNPGDGVSYITPLKWSLNDSGNTALHRKSRMTFIKDFITIYDKNQSSNIDNSNPILRLHVPIGIGHRKGTSYTQNTAIYTSKYFKVNDYNKINILNIKYTLENQDNYTIHYPTDITFVASDKEFSDRYVVDFLKPKSVVLVGVKRLTKLQTSNGEVNYGDAFVKVYRKLDNDVKLYISEPYRISGVVDVNNSKHDQVVGRYKDVKSYDDEFEFTYGEDIEVISVQGIYAFVDTIKNVVSDRTLRRDIHDLYLLSLDVRQNGQPFEYTGPKAIENRATKESDYRRVPEIDDNTTIDDLPYTFTIDNEGVVTWDYKDRLSIRI